MPDKKKVTIIDGDSIIYIAAFANIEGEKNEKIVLSICKNVLNNILTITNSEYYCAYLSGKSFRSEIGVTKQYKGNRKAEKPEYFDICRAYLQNAHNFTSEYNYEADDLCIMSYYALKEEYDVIISSPDKDLRQVPCNFYDYKYNRFIEVDNDKAKYNLWFQVLIGDVTDNIAGCEGIGKVKAEKLLSDSTNYMTTTLEQYTKVYGEYNGILKFTENYRLCKMLERTFDNEIYTPELFENNNYKDNESSGDLW